MGEAIISRTSKIGGIAVVNELGDSETSVISQNASNTLLAHKEHIHTINDLKNTYFYEMNVFDVSRYAYTNIKSMIYSNSYYMGILQSDTEALFVYSRDGINFKKIKISDSVSYGITTPIFTVVKESFDYTIVLLYGDKNYTLCVRNLSGSSPLFTERYFKSAPIGAVSPDKLQYLTDIYYLNERYGSSKPLGGIWTSPDGLTWNKIYDGACKELLMKDGTFWMNQPNSSAPSPSLERGIYTSTNLTDWTSVWKPGDFSDTQSVTAFQYVNGEFVFSTYYNIYKSVNGIDWTKIVPKGAGSSGNSNLVYDDINNRWLWYSYSSAASDIYTSKNLEDWTLLYSYPTTTIKNAVSIIPTSSKTIIFAGSIHESWDLLIHDDASQLLIPQSNGGTGANTAEAARNNLDVYSKNEVDSKISSSVHGTWTPELGYRNSSDSPTHTITQAKGFYSVYGQWVYITFIIKGTITNATKDLACIKGLPFKSFNSNAGGYSLSIIIVEGLVRQGGVGFIPDNSDQIFMRTMSGDVEQSWTIDAFEISYSGWYLKQ